MFMSSRERLRIRIVFGVIFTSSSSAINSIAPNNLAMPKKLPVDLNERIETEIARHIEGLLGVYELHRVELLRDIFIRAYERSCQQYIAVRQQLVPPDAVRLRYCTQLSALVAAIVRSGAKADLAKIRTQVPGTVTDRERFVALAMEEFQNMHSGNVIRFGLRPGGKEIAAMLTRR